VKNSDPSGHLPSGELKPIETLYGSYRFRSRLEARWAVFFDVIGIEWRYEPEGFDLMEVKIPHQPEYSDPSGKPLWYLPDFYLPKQDYWIEIKPQRPTRGGVIMIERLLVASRKKGFIFWGNIRFSEEIRISNQPEDESTQPRGDFTQK